MNATLRTLVWTLTAALVLATGSASADDGSESADSPQAGGACEWFYYSLNPPAWQIDLSCIGPLLDSSP